MRKRKQQSATAAAGIGLIAGLAISSLGWVYLHHSHMSVAKEAAATPQPAATNPLPSDIRQRLDEVLAWQATPDIFGIDAVPFQGKTVKLKKFEIAPGPHDPMRLASWTVPSRWRPDTEHPESNLPYPWPDNYAKERHQPFNADTFMYDMAALANWVKAGGEREKIAPYVDYLVGRLNEYLTPVGDAALVTYRFDYQFHDKPLPTGWVSAYGNASALAGISYLSAVTHDERLLPLARKLFLAYSAFETDSQKWIATIDDDQYVWFEEYPIEGPKKAHVLNGHIWSVFALYCYFSLTGDPDARTLMDAGLTTLNRYLLKYRYPGKINRYDLYAAYNPDYFPQNTVDEERRLYDLTGEPFFAKMAERFTVDMPYRRPN